MRYVLLLSSLSVMVSPVLAPAVARLAAGGETARGLGHVALAIRSSFILLYPATVVLIAFAGDALAAFNPAFRSRPDLLRWAALAVLSSPVIQFGSGVAAALGLLRPYLVTSILFVVSSLAITSFLVPAAGIGGAAMAIALGALVQHLLVTRFLARRASFRVPIRSHLAWACAAATSATFLAVEPGRTLATALAAGSIVVFAVVGGIRAREIRSLITTMLRRDDAVAQATIRRDES